MPHVHGHQIEPPEVPSGRIEITAPPSRPQGPGGGDALTNAVPMLGGLGSVVLVATMGTGAGQGRAFIAAGAFLVVTVGLVLVQFDRQRRQRIRSGATARSDYLRYLGTVRATLREAAARQRAALRWQHPDPASLPILAEERSRIWGRAPDHKSFLQVRYGVSHQPLSSELVAPDAATIDRVDPAAASALHRLLAVHREQPDLPTAADLRAHARIEICGVKAKARSLARAMICSAAALHSPDHLAVAVLASEDTVAEWDWVKWLPHSWSVRQCDAVGPRRMVATSLADLRALLRRNVPSRDVSKQPPGPHLLLVVDGGTVPTKDPVVPAQGPLGLTVLDLPSRWGDIEDESCLRLLLEDEGDRRRRPVISVRRVRGAPRYAVADQCDLATAEALARRLTPLPGATHGGCAESSGESPRPADLMDLLDLGDIHHYEPATVWSSQPARGRLRVPIGIDDRGAPVHLDLKESAQQGMGPHGLVIGATGSGKSELLRTVVLGLALTHSPEQLNMVLVDFKGGATFAGMSDLPHVSAVITNLEQELALVDRMQDALSGEILRRERLLREAGGHASMRDYERARAAGAPLTPLASLFIVVDEFSEMLSAKPEFIDLFVAIGRLGRSLGLHLLLASQRLEEGRLHGLESHLSYRVGLRTFSAHESRAVLGVPDAYELPPTPGLGLLKTDPTALSRFTAAHVSGPLRPAVRATFGSETRTGPGILPWTIAEVPAPASRSVSEPRPAPRPEQDPSLRESLLDVAVGRMKGFGPAAHRVWLPPLDVPDTLDVLMADLASDPRLGLVSRRARAHGALVVPVGTVDRPRLQSRDRLMVDLSGAGGHVAVVGGPRSGKTTLLQTLVTGLSLTTTPVESQFYVLDFGGGTFTAMRVLPHLAGIASRSEPDVVRRTVAEVTGIVDRREALFRTLGIDSVATYRTRRAQGLVDDGYGDVFLVVDGWSTLRSEFDDLEVALQRLAARGLTFGFHLVTSSSRWGDYRATVRDLMGTRLELRLGDPIDSEIDRRLATLVPAGCPGRGLVADRLHFLTALPRIDGDPDPATLDEGIRAMAAQVAEAWTGPAGPKLHLLPELLPADDLLALAGDRAAEARLLLGIDEKLLAPVGLDPDTDPHWLVFGDGRSGKSTALRTYVHEVMRTRGPERAQILLVDYRRSLLGEVPDDYLLDHLTSTRQATSALTELAAYLEKRLPGPEVTPEQLRRRTWWTGAEVFVVVDDYDLVANGRGSPVEAVQPLLAQSREVGLHLVVARRSGGASRALFEPVIQSLRDLAAPGLVLSGSPEEGALIGTVRPVPAPAGRGRLVTRDRGTEVIQLTWRDPAP